MLWQLTLCLCSLFFLTPKSSHADDSESLVLFSPIPIMVNYLTIKPDHSLETLHHVKAPESPLQDTHNTGIASFIPHGTYVKTDTTITGKLRIPNDPETIGFSPRDDVTLESGNPTRPFFFSISTEDAHSCRMAEAIQRFIAQTGPTQQAPLPELPLEITTTYQANLQGLVATLKAIGRAYWTSKNDQTTFPVGPMGHNFSSLVYNANSPFTDSTHPFLLTDSDGIKTFVMMSTLSGDLTNTVLVQYIWDSQSVILECVNVLHWGHVFQALMRSKIVVKFLKSV